MIRAQFEARVSCEYHLNAYFLLQSKHALSPNRSHTMPVKTNKNHI